MGDFEVSSAMVVATARRRLVINLAIATDAE